MDEEDTIKGLITGVSVDNTIFNDDKTAVAKLFYILPEYRSIRIANTLLKTFEYWANDVKKVNSISLGNPMRNRLSKYYNKKGYVEQEHIYVKEFN